MSIARLRDSVCPQCRASASLACASHGPRVWPSVHLIDPAIDAAFAQLSKDFTQLVADLHRAKHLSPELERQAQAFGLRFDALARLVAGQTETDHP